MYGNILGSFNLIYRFMSKSQNFVIIFTYTNMFSYAENLFFNEYNF